jgi:hypothetical protein
MTSKPTLSPAERLLNRCVQSGALTKAGIRLTLNQTRQAIIQADQSWRAVAGDRHNGARGIEKAVDKHQRQ